MGKLTSQPSPQKKLRLQENMLQLEDTQQEELLGSQTLTCHKGNRSSNHLV